MFHPLDLAVRWNHGTDGEPPFQVHHAGPGTVILRQSMRANFEAPFLFLLFDSRRALLFDTGATTDSPLRSIVDGLVTEWLDAHPAADYDVVVAHSHSHGDHVAGDAQFADAQGYTVVGLSEPEIAEFFRLGDWPGGSATFDLGERELTILPIPGHHPSSIALYDEQTRSLLTGDTVYPGRLYARDFEAFATSIERLWEFAQQHPVDHVLGAHIEMSTRAGWAYPMGAARQPQEADLPMTAQQLGHLRDAVAKSAKPGAHLFADFAIWNGPCQGAVRRELLRGRIARLRGHYRAG